MKTTTAFRAIRSGRQAARNQGGFVVRAVTKSGSLSKVCSRDHTGRYEFTAQEATELQQRLQLLNPGHFWSVVPA